MNKKTIGAIIVLVAVLFGVYLLTKRPANADPIRIGAIISQSGVAAAFGEYSLNAARLAVDEINAKGGINGRTVELVVEDDHTSAKDATTAFNKLVGYDHVDAVFGGIFDFTAQPLLPLALNQQVTFITPINARIPSYFEPNAQSFVMLSDFEKIIRKLTPVIQQSHAKRLAVIRFGSEFGKEITRTLKNVMEENGGQLVLDEEYGQIGGNDFRTVILKTKQANPDIVFIDMLSSDAVAFLKRAKENHLTAVIMTHEDIIDALENTNVDTKLLEGVVIVNWGHTASSFNDLYRAKYGKEAAKSADKSYEAVYILAEAVANSQDRASVAHYIETHEFSPTGSPIRFTKEHAAEEVPVEIEVIKNGKLTPFQ